MPSIKPTASAHDVAAYIIAKKGSMTAMKLQKLIYYCQAWSLVWDERPLFRERIQAWANGPVVFEIYDQHRGAFEVAEWKTGNPGKLDALACKTIDAVLRFYGKHTSQWLSDLTHRETPWKEARQGLAMAERGQREITHAAMAEYYQSLMPSARRG